MHTLTHINTNSGINANLGLAPSLGFLFLHFLLLLVLLFAHLNSRSGTHDLIEWVSDHGDPALGLEAHFCERLVIVGQQPLAFNMAILNALLYFFFPFQENREWLSQRSVLRSIYNTRCNTKLGKKKI